MPRSARKKPALHSVSAGESEEAARTAKIASGLQLSDLQDDERAFLATCQTIYRRVRGCDSPFEEFFSKMVVSISHVAEVFPERLQIAGNIVGRRPSAVRESAGNFMEAYPDEFAAISTKQTMDRITEAARASTAARHARKITPNGHAAA